VNRVRYAATARSSWSACQPGVSGEWGGFMLDHDLTLRSPRLGANVARSFDRLARPCRRSRTRASTDSAIPYRSTMRLVTGTTAFGAAYQRRRPAITSGRRARLPVRDCVRPRRQPRRLRPQCRGAHPRCDGRPGSVDPGPPAAQNQPDRGMTGCCRAPSDARIVLRAQTGHIRLCLCQGAAGRRPGSRCGPCGTGPDPGFSTTA
jgi:hypothetical protein